MKSTQIKLIHQINNENNKGIKYFLLNQYLNKYIIIKEFDRSRNQYFCYFKIKNDIFCIDCDVVKYVQNLDDAISGSSKLFIDDPFWTNEFEIFKKPSSYTQIFIEIIKDHESE
jgi:hypothetical protein